MSDNPKAQFDWSLVVDCPKCGEQIDLLDDNGDDDGHYSRPIFRNRWDELVNDDVWCRQCDHEFKISGVEY